MLPNARPRRVWFIAALTIACSSSSTPPSYSATIQEAQDAAWEALSPGDATSLAIAVGDARGLVYAEGFGVADRDTRTAAGADTMFPIGSVSKMFAAAAVMQLAERGLLELEKPVKHYVPAFTMHDPRHEQITVRMLIDHSAGLLGSSDVSAWTTEPWSGYPATLLSALATQDLKAAPGFMSVYSNDGFSLVEWVVKEVTGKDFAHYVQDEILTPLKMSHSRYPLAFFPAGTFARTYANGIGQPQEILNQPAAGGMYASASDMIRFARVFLGGGAVDGQRLLSAESIAAMAVDRTAQTFNPVKCWTFAYGLGWDTVASPGLRAVGVTGWAKGGATIGYQAQLLVAPEAGLAVVVLGTRGTRFSPGPIAERVMLRALAETGRIRSYPSPLPALAAPVAPPPAGLVASMAGDYTGTLGGGTTFRLAPNGDGSLQIRQWSDRAWAVTADALSYRSDGWFTSDADPRTSWTVVDARGTKYLARRGDPHLRGAGHVLDQWAVAELVRPPASSLSAAWTARTHDRWLVVDVSPVDLGWTAPSLPTVTIEPFPDAPGILSVSGQLLDASRSDDRAEPFVVIPGMWGRDFVDVAVKNAGADERLVIGGYTARPLSTVPSVNAGSSVAVTIGAEAQGEWRSIPASPARALTVDISGATAWKLYDATEALVSHGTSSGSASLPSGSGSGLLLVGAPAGAQVTISVR